MKTTDDLDTYRGFASAPRANQADAFGRFYAKVTGKAPAQAVMTGGR